MDWFAEPIDIQFQDLPYRFKYLKSEIHDNLLLSMYKNFKFKYYNNSSNYHSEGINNEEILIYSLSNYLKENKFITYSSFLSQNDNNPSSYIKYLVICVEKQCIILESINKNIISSIFKKGKAIIIDCNDSSPKSNDIQTEIENISQRYTKLIKQNEFIRLTIPSISCYLIRRYSCPSSYFRDKSFFYFKEKPDPNEEFFKDEIEIISKMNTDSQLISLKSHLNKFFNQLQIDLKESQKTMPNPNEPQFFEQKDFIKLRNIFTTNNVSYFLVMHIDSLHIFAMKIFTNNLESHKNDLEINFCKINTNRCFTKCYGFICEDNNSIVGILYKYMGNDSTARNKGNLNEILSFTIMIRLFHEIKYLQSNQMIHRDLKPSNILLDHDFIPFIHDFETIRKIDPDLNNNYEFTTDFGSVDYASPEQLTDTNGTISFPTDIFSFGKILNYLFPKKMNEEISNKITNFSKLCTKIDQNERPSLNDIEIFINELIESFYLKHYFIMRKINQTKEPFKLFQFFYEIIVFQIVIQNKDKINDYLIDHIFYYFLLHLPEKQFDCSLGLFLSMKPGIYSTIQLQTSISGVIFSLGTFYLMGEGVEKDPIKAIEYLELAAQDNNTNAIWYLAQLYYEDELIETDYSKSKEYLEKLVPLNKHEAIFLLGLLYYEGKGVEKNYEKAKEYFESSAKQGDHNALLYLGRMYFLGDGVDIDYSRSVKYFELSSQHGNSDASLFLGAIYYSGEGVNVNYQKSIMNFELSAKQGNDVALYNLGIIYYIGEAVKANYEIARKYFDMAVQKGNLNAQYCIGMMYLYGRTVRKDYLTARRIFESLLKDNNLFAFYGLGIIYKDGLGVAVDHLRAKYYFELAAKNNNSFANYQLGLLYYDGKGVEKNYSMAINFLEKAAKEKNTEAQLKLAELYINEKGVKKDIRKGKKYIISSAKHENSESLFKLGLLYYNGEIFHQNYIRSFEYFYLASQKKNPKAYFYIGSQYENGKYVDIDIRKAIEYYQKCILEKDFMYVNISENIDMIEEVTRKNDLYYRCYNNLGLIYLLDYKPLKIELALKYIKEAAFAPIEYPIGQNNLGLCYQYFSNEYDKAEYMFQRSSKHNLALAEYNLGYFYEKVKNEGIDKKAIDHYLNASKNEEKPFAFNENIINDDERLNISQTYIICLTNLKLTSYFLSQANNEKAEYFLTKAIVLMKIKNYMSQKLKTN